MDRKADHSMWTTRSHGGRWRTLAPSSWAATCSDRCAGRGLTAPGSERCPAHSVGSVRSNCREGRMRRTHGKLMRTILRRVERLEGRLSPYANEASSRLADL